MMNEDTLNTARAGAVLLGARMPIAIPSILAEGETFAAKTSVTGAHALPLPPGGVILQVDGSMGIAGLPRRIALDPDITTGIRQP